MPIGKIVKALSGFYYVKSGDTITQCRARGNFRKRKITPLVGDMAEYESSSLTDGYILSIGERNNALIRPPVANIDQAILVFSAKEPNFDDGLLDRFLVHIEAHGLDAIICVTKMDLIQDDSIALGNLNIYAERYKKIGYPFLLMSSIEGDGLEALVPYLSEKTSVLAGQSGVGKSSLLNAINPSLSIETGEISQALGRGKHTTRHVELLPVAEGYVADTPGFSSLEFSGIEADELDLCFPEFRSRSTECKFRGCTHLSEPGCAVKEAVDSGDVDQVRYNHYQQFYEEISSRKKRY